MSTAVYQHLPCEAMDKSSVRGCCHLPLAREGRVTARLWGLLVHPLALWGSLALSSDLSESASFSVTPCPPSDSLESPLELSSQPLAAVGNCFLRLHPTSSNPSISRSWRPHLQATSYPRYLLSSFPPLCPPQLGSGTPSFNPSTHWDGVLEPC